jgi:short-subunit dehydrogenase
MKKSRVVVITGASAGVGRATAIAFAKTGARIGLIARGQAGLNGAKRDVEAAGGRALILMADVADDEQVEAAAMAVDRQFGPVDVWVNNAMCSVFSPIQSTTAAEFKRVTEVTYLGVVHGTLAALRRMQHRDDVAILQVGSALAYRSIPLQAAYCAAKHAIAGFTDSLRCELIHDRSRIRLSMVNLPAMNTPQFGWSKSRMSRKAQPVPPIFQPEVAATAIEFASRHFRREWNVGLPTVEAILGQKIAPGLLDRYLGRTGYDGQLTREIEDPGRDNNLWEPVNTDPGAHGSFSDRAHPVSWQARLSRHRRLCAIGGLMAVAGMATRGYLLRNHSKT